ncbi:hypothetical protein L9F63_006212, partial [Diploptera punctata]
NIVLITSKFTHGLTNEGMHLLYWPEYKPPLFFKFHTWKLKRTLLIFYFEMDQRCRALVFGIACSGMVYNITQQCSNLPITVLELFCMIGPIKTVTQLLIMPGVRLIEKPVKSLVWTSLIGPKGSQWRLITTYSITQTTRAILTKF